MSIRQFTNHRGRMVRQVVVDGLGWTVVDSVGDWIPIQVTSPSIEVAESDESPRFRTTWIIGWADGYKGFVDPPNPGARIETASYGTFELLSPPRWLREHNDRDGWTALCQPLDFLYPLTGELQAQDGTVVQEDVILAMWGSEDRQETASRYEDHHAECPIDVPIEMNRQIVIDDRVFRVYDTVIDRVGPRVKMTLRVQK